MTKQGEDTDFTLRVRPRGGSGRNAMWQWEVYASGNALPIQKGVYKGAEVKAFDLARAAMLRQTTRRCHPAKLA